MLEISYWVILVVLIIFGLSLGVKSVGKSKDLKQYNHSKNKTKKYREDI